MQENAWKVSSKLAARNDDAQIHLYQVSSIRKTRQLFFFSTKDSRKDICQRAVSKERHTQFIIRPKNY